MIRRLAWHLFWSCCGVLGAWLTLLGIHFFSELWEGNPNLLWAAPALPWLPGWGNFADSPRKHLFFVWASHLCGAAVGREAAATRTGYMLAKLWSGSGAHVEARNKELSSSVLAAAFGFALSNPLAGFFFSWGLHRRSNRALFSLSGAVVGAAVAFSFGLFSSHALYTFSPKLDAWNWAWTPFFLILPVACMAVSQIWIRVGGQLREGWTQSTWWHRVAVSALLIVLIVSTFHQRHLFGLGLGWLELSALDRLTLQVWLAKFCVLLIFFGFGFRGGEFVPLWILGMGLGVMLGDWFLIPKSLSSILGGAMLYGSASGFLWVPLMLVPLTSVPWQTLLLFASALVILLKLFKNKPTIYDDWKWL